jgi:hypothetical protein
VFSSVTQIEILAMKEEKPLLGINQMMSGDTNAPNTVLSIAII